MVRLILHRIGAFALALLMLVSVFALSACGKEEEPAPVTPVIRTVHPDPFTASHVFLQRGTDMTNINSNKADVLETLVNLVNNVTLKTSPDMLTLDPASAIHIIFTYVDDAGITRQIKFDLDNCGVARYNDVKYNLEDYETVYRSVNSVYELLKLTA